MEVDLYISFWLGMHTLLSRYVSTSVKHYGTSPYKKYTGPPQLRLSGLYTTCCVKGEDRSGRWDLSGDLTAAPSYPKLPDHDRGPRRSSSFYSISALTHLSLSTVRSVQYNHWKPLSLCGHLSTAERFHNSRSGPRSTEFNWLNC